MAAVVVVSVVFFLLYNVFVLAGEQLLASRIVHKEIVMFDTMNVNSTLLVSTTTLVVVSEESVHHNHHVLVFVAIGKSNKQRVMLLAKSVFANTHGISIMRHGRTTEIERLSFVERA